jgi:AcrR family transcriptional regulator
VANGSASPRPDDSAVTRFEPTSQRGRRTRAALLVGARQAFEELGYAETNVAAITRAAGVGYGSFYVYFPSKEEIFDEVVRNFIETIYTQSRAAQTGDPLDRVAAENQRFFQLYRENARMFQLIEEQAAVDPHFQSVRRKMRDLYATRTARALKRLQDSGAMDPTLDPEYTTYALLAMVERMAHLAVVHDLDGERMQHTIDQLWRNAIRYQPHA